MNSGSPSRSATQGSLMGTPFSFIETDSERAANGVVIAGLLGWLLGWLMAGLSRPHRLLAPALPFVTCCACFSSCCTRRRSRSGQTSCVGSSGAASKNCSTSAVSACRSCLVVNPLNLASEFTSPGSRVWTHESHRSRHKTPSSAGLRSVILGSFSRSSGYSGYQGSASGGARWIVV